MKTAHMNLPIHLTLTLVFTLCATLRAQDAPHTKTNKFFESAMESKSVIPLHGAFARLWLNRELPEVNRLLRDAQLAIIKQEGGSDVMTAEIANSEHVKWQMRTWNRLYQLFNEKSRFYPGRLDKESQAMIEEMFWLYVCEKSHIERAGLEHVWGIHGSENHEMMHYSNALLALQALKESPTYKDRKLPDGRSPKEHYEAWNAYYKHYCDERAKHGLLIEVFSQYGKYTMAELFNMCDLAEDPALRGKMEKLLHLIWADWAVGQLTGVRGGGRTRTYQGAPDQLLRKFSWGSRDHWPRMAKFLMDGDEWPKITALTNHPIHGWPLVLATTNYRLPDVIKDIAKDPVGRGEYVYTARRIAKQRHLPAKDVPVTYSPWYAFDGNDPGMLGYDYCTPDYVMGSLIIDPTLPLVRSHVYLEGKDLQQGYPALTAQNRYQAIVFASNVNARVVPQCVGLSNGKTYGEQQTVQHENIMLTQRHARAKQTGDMRILFGEKGMKERVVERDGWMILKEGNAWLGIKGFSRTEANKSCGSKWDNEVFLRMNDGNAPVALIAGRTSKFPDIDAFSAYLSQIIGSPGDGWFDLTKSNDPKLTLSLQLAAEALPKVNGKPIDLNPKMLFDSPFMKSVHGSGVVTIRKGDRILEIDMKLTD